VNIEIGSGCPPRKKSPELSPGLTKYALFRNEIISLSWYSVKVFFLTLASIADEIILSPVTAMTSVFLGREPEKMVNNRGFK